MRPSGSSSFNRGRGRGKNNAPPSYSAVINNEASENIEVYDKNEKDEVILLLEPRDLQWRDDPWQIMMRYFDTASYVVPTYKYIMHYEIILSSIRSAEFQHFYPVNTKKIFTPEEWGTSTMKECEYTQQDQKIAIKFNYWDYIESFNKALLYENTNKNHLWVIKICSNVFKQYIPNWFCQWWTLYGPTLNILPEDYKKLYAQWVDVSPKIINLQQEDIEVQTNEEGFPCLKIKFHRKFWCKLLQRDAEGKLHGREIVDSINVSIEASKRQTEVIHDKDAISPFKPNKKLQMKKWAISKSELLAS
ncbi:hypothetical protein H5410_060481 [Solanum commersonii]|uniref:Uncharacterized protein n=1 Tax=Solanum commersonii TaxID=4109 RepID=A0A9J5W565_SOLCO|nr:hypothetical protein H5410_060481 [Solanum commersonii]